MAGYTQYNPWADINATGNNMAGTFAQLMLGLAQEKARQREFAQNMAQQQAYLQLARGRDTREQTQYQQDYALRQQAAARAAEQQKLSVMLAKNEEARSMAKFSHEKGQWPAQARMQKAEVSSEEAGAEEKKARAQWYKQGGTATQRVASELFRLEQQRMSTIKQIETNQSMTPMAKQRLAVTTNQRFNRLADVLRASSATAMPGMFQQTTGVPQSTSGGGFEYDPATDQMVPKQ